MYSKAAKIVRICAVVQIGLALMGLSLLLLSAAILASGGKDFRGLPLLPYAFVPFAALDASCLVLLIVGGVLVWKLRRRGVLISRAVLTFEIVYWVFSPLIGAFLVGIGIDALTGETVSTAVSSAAAGRMPQILTLYPVIGLVVLDIARRKLDRAQTWSQG